MSIDLEPGRVTPGVSIDNYRAGLGEYLSAVADDAWSNSPLAQISRLGLVGGYEEQARERGETLLSTEQANEKGRTIGLNFTQPISQGAYDVIAQEKQESIARESTFQRARLEAGYGTMKWLLAGGTEFLMQAVDPINVAASFIPVVGEAKFAAMAARLGKPAATLLKGGLEGAVGQAVLEPLAAVDRQVMGEEYTLLDTVISLTFGSVLGATLHGASYGAGAGFRFVRDKYIFSEPSRRPGREPSPVPGSESAPLHEALREPPTTGTAAEAPVVETRQEPSPRQPVAEQHERLNPATKETALRAGVAQLLQDKPVDIEPILHADPTWPDIKASIEGLNAHLELQRQAAADAAPAAWTVPATYVPEAAHLAQAQRLARGWTPEVAEKQPLSLSEFVALQGGLRTGTAEAGDLIAADLGKKSVKMAEERGGRALSLVSERGVDVAHLAEQAHELGYPVPRDQRIGSGVDVQGFMNALIEDATGARRMMPDDAYTAAYEAQQQYFSAIHQAIRDLGVDPTTLPARKLAYLLSRDPDHGRLLSLLDRIDRLGEDASLELVARLDREATDLQRRIAEREPGADVEEMAVDHREFPAATLAELDTYYELERRTAVQDTGGRPDLEPSDPFGRPDEGREAPPARPGEAQPAAETPGLRPAGDEGPAAANQGATQDLSAFAERQQKADLHADSEGLARQDERLAAAERELDQMYQDDLKQYGALLSEREHAEIAGLEQGAAEAQRAVDAMASCKIGGG